MNARRCMACGSEVGADAERCTTCGASAARLFHESSDVRVEAERLGDTIAAKDLSGPDQGWGRASEHPPVDGARSTPPTAAAEVPSAAGEAGARATSTTSSAGRPASAVAQAAAMPAAPGDGGLTVGVSGEPAVATWHTTGSHQALADWHTARGHGPTATAEARAMAGNHGPPQVSSARPPVLASEALQRDLAPPEPAAHLLRVWAPLLGLIGTAFAWLLTEGRGLGLPLTGALAALALLGLPRMSYPARAGAVATVSAVGLALALWADSEGVYGPHKVLLTLAVILLTTGLCFRSWHRASALARLIVALGVVLGSAYLWMNDALSAITMFDTTWQSWLPRLLPLPFGLLLMLALLVFMNARTTAASAAWATLVLLWYAAHTAVSLLHAAWPKELDGPDFSRLELESILACSVTPIFATLLSFGLAQLIAASVARTGNTTRPRQALLAH